MSPRHKGLKKGAGPLYPLFVAIRRCSVKIVPFVAAVLAAGVLGGAAYLGAELGSALGLARFEVPGAAHLFRDRPLRRARVRLRSEVAALDAWVLVPTP